MMLSNLPLPADLVEEILSRVPATSLKRLRSTCKRWNTLLKDPRFTIKNIRNAAKQSMILMLKISRIFSMNVNVNVAPPSIEFKGEIGLLDSHSNSEIVDINQVCHCDGLLLCTTMDNRLVVWNPCLGETRWIHPKTAYKKFSRFALGYQDNNSCRSYKILRTWDNYSLKTRVFEYEIYELSSDTWRVFDDPLDVLIRQNGVSLKGNSYWLATDAAWDKSLVCFDFTTERFRGMSFPPIQNGYFKALSVVREEQLSMLHERIDMSKMELWLTNKFDNQAPLSWRKSLTVDLQTQVYASLLIDEEKKVALCCNLLYDNSTGNKVFTIGEEDEYYSELPYVESTDKRWWLDESSKPCMFNYVPSLVQLRK